MNILLKLLLVVLGIGFILTWRAQSSAKQGEFLSGVAFDPLPDGFWAGSADFPVGSWKGKRFDGATGRGVNVFGSADGEKETAPFRMYAAPALWDRGHTITRIDYNLPENPFYLRPALDEVVQVAPGKLLGKIHYRVLPGISIVLDYFRQEK